MNESETKLFEIAKTLTPVDFLKFVGDRKIDTTCPSCHTTGWHPLDHTKVGLAQILLQDGTAPNVNGTNIPTIILICVNCGFVRSHSALILAQWKLNKEVKNGPA